MADCKACRELVGRSAQVEPHDQLVCESRFMRSDGNLEEYRCRKCGAIWERFDKRLGTSGTTERWTRSTLLEPADPVYRHARAPGERTPAARPGSV